MGVFRVQISPSIQLLEWACLIPLARTQLFVSGAEEGQRRARYAGKQSWGAAGGEERKLTSVTLTTPICGADRSISNVFSQ